ncbi:MraW methylase family protein isoform 1 [Hibiscus syriacus]|uniref:MraW methylase family protein isoform 1 n=1 Tax=Hibiscus syriacus TaxID=106335 RepID=A0A6A2WG33_HIBSY|nr:uncharacterized protein LOC120194419 [Hibiscus syriacus]XP_039052661.1 uncharacterized protein LOC120194419 [Hibiscus syriacus]KAE8656661.1 MraW methylase family protein isoform 1 [Hibiscus syriacus]
MKTVATASSNGWRWSFLSPQLSSSSISPRKATLPLSIKLRLHPYRANNGIVASSDAKRANLSASRTQRVKLPVYDDTPEGNVSGGQPYHISQFLSHPSGIQAILNTRALEKFEFLDTNAYRCTLPKLALFNFEATPVLDLRVIPTEEDCTVELFSCKFKGSEVLERQNEHFSATMTNHITWDTNISEPVLEVDVKLNLSLEVYTRPFILLPISAVEGPGNVMMQALLDRLVPLLLQQLVEDYKKWVQLQKQLIN